MHVELAQGSRRSYLRRTVEVTTYYLEMLDPRQLRPDFSDHPKLVVMQAEVPSPEFSRFLYKARGR